MRYFFLLFFCFFLFLYQVSPFTQVAKAHQSWSEIEAQRFSEVLEKAGVSKESISILMEATNYSQIQKITSFFQGLEIRDQSLADTAAEAFFDYIPQAIDIDTVMGEEWVNKIILDTKSWSVLEAESFLSFLESEEIEFDKILMILKATDYLRVIKTDQVTFILEIETTSSLEAANQAPIDREEVGRADIASDVFIHFARQQFQRELEQKGRFLVGEDFEAAFRKRMGNKGEWESKIIENTLNNSKWTVKDGEDFRDFLRERIGDSAILTVIKKTSFFKSTNYESFLLRWDIFSRYVDREKLTNQLKKHLTSFTKGTPQVISRVIEDVKTYFEEKGEDIVRQALNNNIVVFSLSKNQSTVLVELLHFLEGYIGKAGVKDIILNKPSGFKSFKVKKDSKNKTYILQMPLVVEYIEGYIAGYFGDVKKGKEVVRKIMHKSFYGLALADLEKLKAVVGYIEGYFGGEGKEVVQDIMQNSFYGLALADLEKLKNVIGYIEDYFEDKEKGKEVVQDIMQESFQGLALADLEKLKAVIGYIEDYFKDAEEGTGKAVVRLIMQKSFYGLAVADLEKLKAVIGYIENYFEEEGKAAVRAIMQKSFYGLAVADLEKLQDVVKYIEGYFEDVEKVKEVIRKIMQKSFQGLALANLEKLKAVIGYIEDYFKDAEEGTGKAVVRLIMQNSFKGLAVADLEKLKAVIGYIEDYFKDAEEGTGKAVVRLIMQNSFYGLAVADLEKLKAVIGYIENYFEEEGKAAVRAIMQKSFQGLARADLGKLQDVVGYIEDYFGDVRKGKEVVRKIMQKSFQGLALADLKKQQAVVGYIEGYEGKEVVQDIMQETFYGLAVADLKKLQAVVGYIEVYFEDEEKGKAAVQAIMQKSFQGLALAEREKLKTVVGYIEDYFEDKEKGKEVVQGIMQETFYGLAVADPKKLKSIIEHVKKYTKTEDQKKIIMQRLMLSINLFSRGFDFEEESGNRDFIFDKLNNLLESIDEFIESTQYSKEKRNIWKSKLQDILINFSIEDLEKLYQDINTEITCPEALSKT